MRRRFQIGILAILLMAGVARTPTVAKLASSAKNFGRQFHALKSARNISPIERLVLSLAMTS